MSSVRIARLVLLASLCCASAAQAQVIFSMDYSQGATQSNWGQVEGKPNFTQRWIAGAGPSGQNVWEISQLPLPSLEHWGGQFSWGFHGTVESSEPPRGARRFYRWRMLYPNTVNFRGIDWSDGHPNGSRNKLLIVGNGCGDRCRFILSLDAEYDRREVRNFRIQLDGGEDLADTGSYAIGQWLNMQVELQASSSATAADGGYKLWINNNNYNSPTAQRTGIVLHPYNWNYVILGAYENNGLTVGGVNTYRHTDFQVATSFASSWATTGPVPNPPSSVQAQ